VRIGRQVIMTSTNSREERSGNAVREALAKLKGVYQARPFQTLLDQLWAVAPGKSRHDFVRRTFCDPIALRNSGVELPEGITIQQTYFEDDRPTLLALIQHLEPGLPFEKVTITIDDVESQAPSESGAPNTST
jgi:hypothetical protein